MALFWISESLFLFDNDISGTLPISLGLLSNLEELRANNNKITGTIPKELGVLRNLTTIQLNVNSLTGTLPQNLGALTSLTKLEVHENELSGEVPMNMCTLTSLKFLTADCATENRDIECSCCTRCYWNSLYGTYQITATIYNISATSKKKKVYIFFDIYHNIQYLLV